MTLDRAELSAAISAHGPIARIVIAEHAGSTPRETGTAMLVWNNGQSGTIGGGELEHDAVKRARALLCSGDRTLLLRQPLGPALGQCCGGAVTLLIEVLSDVADIPETGLHVRPVSGVAEGLPLKVQQVLRQARSGQGAAAVLIDGWFCEPVAGPEMPLWIYGAGHVGRALVGTLAGLPFQLTWVDDARERFPETVPPHARMLVASKMQDAVRLAPDNAHHLVLTYSHALDLEICHAVLSRRFAGLGLIGSATKKARFLSRLRDLGHPPAQLSRILCPIGDRSLGKHPQAIAVGVVHGLLKTQAACQSGRTDRGHVA